METKTNETIPTLKGYKVVVLTGSCACNVIDFGNAYYGRRHGIRYECGHTHRTVEAAEKCQRKLLNYSPDGRSCSAKWYNSSVIPVYSGYEDCYLTIGSY